MEPDPGAGLAGCSRAPRRRLPPRLAPRSHPDPRPGELRGAQSQLPEGWSIEVIRIVADGNSVVSEVRVPHLTVGPYYALSFFELEDGRINGGREYWVEESYEKPGPERASWFERM